MKEFKPIKFSDEKPNNDQSIFCVITGELMCLTYQCNGYPLYCPISDDTVHYGIGDYWYKEVSNGQ